MADLCINNVPRLTGSSKAYVHLLIKQTSLGIALRATERGKRGQIPNDPRTIAILLDFVGSATDSSEILGDLICIANASHLLHLDRLQFIFYFPYPLDKRR